MNRKPINFFCFSPLVMLSTFVIEIGAAMYILYKYHMDMAGRLIVAMLVGLGIFQLAEYMVCQNAVILTSLDWARIGYVAITLLPPIGIHLGLTIAQKRNPHLLGAAYGSAVIFSIFFLSVGQGLVSQQCLGNYVIFKTAEYAILPYAVYYYGWLMIGIYLFMSYRDKIKEQQRKQALTWMTIGYLSFMVPTTAVNIIDPRTISGIPSIMCGFAVIMAISLLMKVAPLVLKESKSQPLQLRAK